MAKSDSTINSDTTSSNYSLLITVVKQSGELVYSSKLLNLYSFGGQYLSENLSLEVGSYNLTQFAILKGNTVIYVTPIQGSERAQLVQQPLPIFFSVNENSTTQVEPEVLAVGDYLPQAFGYATFSFSVVKTLKFKIVAYAVDSFLRDTVVNNMIPVPAFLQISQFADTMYYNSKVLNYNLDAKVNEIETIEQSTYYLSVYKNGYYPWHAQYSLAEIRNHADMPIQLHLTKLSNDTIYPPLR